MDLNLFGAEDDALSSSRFSANLKQETYDPLIITFNSIVAGKPNDDKAKNRDNRDLRDRDRNIRDRERDIRERERDIRDRDIRDRDRDRDIRDKTNNPQNITILTQPAVVLKTSTPVDLDAEQKKTQYASCDYVVYVPTSIDLTKEKVDAFYESTQQFKKRFGKLNMNDAAASIFMQWDMFQKFMNEFDKPTKQRMIAMIQKSFEEANANVQQITDGMKNVLDLHDLTAVNNPVNLDEKGDERFVILYTTPVSTGIPVTTDNSLKYLPFASKFCNDTPRPNNQFSVIVPQKALTYYCNYFQLMCMKTNNEILSPVTGSFGRILKYLPPLNSKMPPGKATPVNFTNTTNPKRYAHPSYNVEIVTHFLRGIITGNNLPNREVLRKDNKLKIIQDKTRLYTFKSTPEYNLNYEKLLERLYYKYPCHLTPSAILTKEAKEAIVKRIKDAAPAATFKDCMDAAINACDKTKTHSIVCAVAIATREFIYKDGANCGPNAGDVLTLLFTTIDFGGGANAVLKLQIQAHLTAYNTNTAPIAVNQLCPLIGAACAAGDSVYAAAKLTITNFVKANGNTSKVPALAAIKKAMDSAIDNLDNFAAFAYDNDTLLSLLKYSDKAQAVNSASVIAGGSVNVTIDAANLMQKADYLKTLYQPPTPTKKEKENENEKQRKNEFETIHDDELYVICGPVYFDYTWIFKQNPELIKHILGEMNEKDLKELREGWTPVEDPLTENKYHINPKPEEASYPKMRFDNPTKMPSETTPKSNATSRNNFTYSWKEQYVSPSQAKDDNTILNINAKLLSANGFASVQLTNAVAAPPPADSPDASLYIHSIYNANNYMRTTSSKKYLGSITDWKTPGYYQYECTQKIARQNGTRKWENKHIQLMRPPTYENGLQDYTEPNLPTAYPPPLMSIVPPFRGPTNTFVIHAWIPGETLIAEDGTLNQHACMDHMYKMMQLIFKTAEKNAGEITSKKRICIKIMAVGYEREDASLKRITRSEDKRFIGDAFFSAIRDYSMLYESTLRVTLYYDTKTQTGVKMRYDDYVSQRMSVLRKANPSAMDTSLHLKIANVDDFFTLKWYPDSDQLSKDDLLYFVDYCSSPRAFIGNMGEWPENIEEVMDDAIKGTNPQPLLACLHNAFDSINRLYGSRGIKEKMEYMIKALTQWNDIQNVNTTVQTFNNIINNINDLCAESGLNIADQLGSSSPMDIMVSWWTFSHGALVTAIPQNAYISSFDEHVMILHNLLSNGAPSPPPPPPAGAAGAGAPPPPPPPLTTGWAATPLFDNLTTTNATVNYGPCINSAFTSGTNNTFENAVYAYTQAKKILTLLSKMKYDEIQIKKNDHDKIEEALAALNALDVKMSWSMDAKFTTAVAEGAFIPNSSALHNPFMCPKLLDPKEWQFMEFEDIGVREIAGAAPVSQLLKPFIDAKIKASSGGYYGGFGGYGHYGRPETPKINQTSALIVSKQPNMERFKKNLGIILENMFHRNAPMLHNGTSMVFNNYAWNKELFYKKRDDKATLQQLTSSSSGSSSSSSKFPDFAKLMGIRAQSGKCFSFPLFVIQLTLYLYQGKLSDMTGTDVAKFACALDGNMFKTNAQIVWDQMMKGLQTHSQNFTVENVLKRLGRPTSSEEYTYNAKYDFLPPGPPPPHVPGTAADLIAEVNRATNPTLKTTNVETLKKIKEQIAGSSLVTSPLYSHGNDLDGLIRLAELYNAAELGAVNTNPATLGWNAAKQTESTVLYMNRFATKEGVSKNIGSELEALNPGDRIIITHANGGIINLTQAWLLTGKPKTNPRYSNVIVVPVEHVIRPFKNVISSAVSPTMLNDIQLKVVLERFTDNEIYSGGTRGAIGPPALGVAPGPAPALVVAAAAPPGGGAGGAPGGGGGGGGAVPAGPVLTVTFPDTMIELIGPVPTSNDLGTRGVLRLNAQQTITIASTDTAPIGLESSDPSVVAVRYHILTPRSYGESVITIRQSNTTKTFTLKVDPGFLIARPNPVIFPSNRVTLTPCFYTINPSTVKIGTTPGGDDIAMNTALTKPIDSRTPMPVLINANTTYYLSFAIVGQRFETNVTVTVVNPAAAAVPAPAPAVPVPPVPVEPTLTVQPTGPIEVGRNVTLTPTYTGNATLTHLYYDTSNPATKLPPRTSMPNIDLTQYASGSQIPVQLDNVGDHRFTLSDGTNTKSIMVIVAPAGAGVAGAAAVPVAPVPVAPAPAPLTLTVNPIGPINARGTVILTPTYTAGPAARLEHYYNDDNLPSRNIGDIDLNQHTSGLPIPAVQLDLVGDHIFTLTDANGTTTHATVTVVNPVPAPPAPLVRPTITGSFARSPPIIINKIATDKSFDILTPQSDSNGVFTYDSVDGAVATIGHLTGRVTIHKVGTTIINITQAATDKYTSITLQIQLNVAPAAGAGAASPKRTPTITYDGRDLNGQTVNIIVGRNIVIRSTSDGDVKVTYSSHGVVDLLYSKPTKKLRINALQKVGQTIVTLEQVETELFNPIIVTFTVVVEADAAPPAVPAPPAPAPVPAPAPTLKVNHETISVGGTVTLTPTYTGNAMLTYTYADDSGTKPPVRNIDLNTQIPIREQLNDVGTHEYTLTDAGGSVSVTVNVNPAPPAAGPVAGAAGPAPASAPLVTPTITGVEATINKIVTDDPFTIKPTSNSAGVFTYDSLDKAVATINSINGEVKLHNVGRSTIIINQAAHGKYDSTFRTFSLNVRAAEPTLAVQPTGPIEVGETVTLTPTYTGTAKFYVNGELQDEKELLTNRKIFITTSTSDDLTCKLVQFDGQTVTVTIPVNKQTPIIKTGDGNLDGQTVNMIVGGTLAMLSVSDSDGNLSVKTDNRHVDVTTSGVSLRIEAKQAGKTIVTLNQTETAKFKSIEVTFTVVVEEDPAKAAADAQAKAASAVQPPVQPPVPAPAPASPKQTPRITYDSLDLKGQIVNMVVGGENKVLQYTSDGKFTVTYSSDNRVTLLDKQNTQTLKIRALNVGQTDVTLQQAGTELFDPIEVKFTVVVRAAEAKQTPFLLGPFWNMGIFDLVLDHNNPNNSQIITPPRSESKGEISYENTNPEVASLEVLNNDNEITLKITPLMIGKTTIIATQAATHDFSKATAKIEYNVTEEGLLKPADDRFLVAADKAAAAAKAAADAKAAAPAPTPTPTPTPAPAPRLTVNPDSINVGENVTLTPTYTGTATLTHSYTHANGDSTRMESDIDLTQSGSQIPVKLNGVGVHVFALTDDNGSADIKEVTVNARPSPPTVTAPVPVPLEVQPIEPITVKEAALSAVAAENALPPTLIKLKPGSAANDLGTYGHLFEPCKNVFKIDASSLSSSSSSSDVTYASSNPQVASFLTQHLGICSVDSIGETVITINDPTSTIVKQFTLRVSDKFLIASPDSSSDKPLEPVTRVTLTPYFYTLDQNTNTVKLGTTSGGSEMSSSSSNPPLKSGMEIPDEPTETTTYYLSFTDMLGLPAEITTTVYVKPAQAQPQAAAQPEPVNPLGPALGLGSLPTPSAAAAANVANLAKSAPATSAGSKAAVPAVEVAPVVDQTLIQYIGSHKSEFKDLKMQMLNGTKPDDEIVSFVVSRLGCDQLIRKNPLGNPCNNPNASHMYADLVNLIANETPFNDQKIKQLIIKLCEGDCANWDSFYYIFEAMDLQKIQDISSRRSIIDKFVTLFGGYLVLGAHFTTNVKNDITIGWFDNIGKLHTNDLLERPDNIEWTKLNHSKWKWYGYSSTGDKLANDKLTPSEINNALKKWFPHNPTYKFELSDTADLQISNFQQQQQSVIMEMGGRRRTKRNANRNAISISKRRNGDQKRPTKKNIKNIPLKKSRSTRRRK